MYEEEYNYIKKLILILKNNEKIVFKKILHLMFIFEYDKINNELLIINNFVNKDKYRKIKVKDIIKIKLYECNFNNYIPDFLSYINFINLEELYIDGYLYFLDLPNNLTSLKKLTIKRSKINYIPNNLINLKELNLQLYTIDKEIKLPYIFYNLKKLKIESNNIYNIPDTYINLKYLNLKFCDKIKTLPNLLNLKKLILDCSKIIYIPNNLIKLNHMSLYQCHNINYIPKTLINLKYLKIYNCNINNIPKTLINIKYF